MRPEHSEIFLELVQAALLLGEIVEGGILGDLVWGALVIYVQKRTLGVDSGHDGGHTRFVSRG